MHDIESSESDGVTFVMKCPARTVGSVTSAAEIVPLGPESLGKASAVLARAFHDTALARFVAPDARQRRRLLPLMYETVLRYSLRYGTVLATPDVSGVCCCLGPQRPGVVGGLEDRRQELAPGSSSLVHRIDSDSPDVPVLRRRNAPVQGSHPPVYRELAPQADGSQPQQG